MLKLLDSESVPDIVRELVEVSIIGDYHRLAQADRMAMVGQLAEIAQKPNLHAAAAALRGLGRIAGFDKSMWTYLTPAALGGAAGTYRKLRDRGLVSKTESLESGFAGSQDPPR